MDWSPEICLTTGKTLCRVCVDIRKLSILLRGYILSSALWPSITPRFCQEQAAGVERTTSGMSGLIRPLAPGDRGLERMVEVEVESGINSNNVLFH